jgi:hypothetical protein
MPYPVRPRPSPRRRGWTLLLSFGAVVILAAGWTGLWFSAAERAKAEIANWRQQERQAGRRQACASESIGGYPFRIELRCASASFELTGTPTLDLRLPFVLAAVRIYDPKLLTAEPTGPLEISEPGLPSKYTAQWSRGEARVHGLPSAVDRASLVLDAPVVRDSSTGNILLKAQRLELDGSQAPGSRPDGPSIEAALRLNEAIADKDVVADKLQALVAKPINADIETIVRGLTDFSPKPWPVRLREWQAQGGQIDITKGRVAQEDLIAVGAGTLKLSARGGLDGNLQVTVVGIEKVLKLFDVERIMSEGQIGSTLSALDRLIPGLGGIARQNAAPGLIAALGQRTVLEGKSALAFPVRFADGTVFLGPFQVGQIPPLF